MKIEKFYDDMISEHGLIDNNKNYNFLIFKTNDLMNEYYISKIHKDMFNKKMDRIKEVYPSNKLKLLFENAENGNYLIESLKERLGDDIIIKFNNVILKNDLTESKFLLTIEEIFEDKDI
jgi:hypothetical protein